MSGLNLSQVYAANPITTNTNTDLMYFVQAGADAAMQYQNFVAPVATAVAVGGITGLGTGVATALAVNVGSAGAFVTFNGAGGTPSSMVGTNITGTAAGLTAGAASAVAVGGISGLGTGVATALAVNVGSAGAFVTFNGALGTPASGILTNCTFPTLNQNTIGTAANLSGTPALPNGTTATTQAALDSSTKLATTAYVDTAVPQAAWSTYSPTVTPGSGSITSYTSAGRYQKIGKTVNFSVILTITNNGTGATNIVFTLPFTSANGSVNYIIFGRESAVVGTILQGLIGPNSSNCTVWNSINSYPAVTGYVLNLTGAYESA